LLDSIVSILFGRPVNLSLMFVYIKENLFNDLEFL